MADVARPTEMSRLIGRATLIQAILPVALVVMVFGFSLVEPRVLSTGNLVNIAIQASYLAIFATAQMVVILTRGFDLSLGTAVSAVSVTSALVMTGMAGPAGEGLAQALILGILMGLAIGVGTGLFNGFAVAWLRVNPFVATLGSLNICLGIATMASDGRPVFNVPDAFSRLVYSGTVAGIPVPILLAGLVLLVTWFILNYTVFGRALYILGGNPRAATVAGIPSRRYLLLAYVMCSVIAALGALMLTGRTGSGEPNLGGNLTLESIAAAVIGGVSLRGGLGGVHSCILGALFITALSNGMNLMRIDGYIQMIVLGCVVILAIFLDRLRAMRS
ncbi:ribose transport system permease protein [Tepidamorphus gemmatus]|uniref:Ribose transport system permease protein n=1 Tax=Tepidamorphus gemmatus TaxID=747076 RepID=A0A4R3MCB2_9HYPH|nr:ABC transporter permease [Tepidamorphus gemmatus]TCT09889.1 ribose transport system permease protein [Tepidamorphus gemmatus]